MQTIFRDPVSGLTHLAGAAAGVVGLIYLLVASRITDAPTLAALTVYGVSLILLYLASAVYHLARVSVARQALLRRLDHAMVPVFIAGSYTPYCIIALKSVMGDVILAVVWALALAGLFKSIYWINAPRWVTAGLFVLMGWMIVFVALPLARAVGPGAFWLVVAGGMAYTVGAAVYAKKWPDPWPPTFGFHEVWHLFVLAGSACHYAAVLLLVTAD